MNEQALIASLERFGGVLLAIVGGLPTEVAARQGPKGEWSILEIVAHLLDEEREDFRARLESTLFTPEKAWPPIDPQGWAEARSYRERPLPIVAAEFVGEREISVAWLHELEAPDWSRAHVHPRLGPIRAGDLLAAWAAHDWLHFRQIAKRLYENVDASAGEYETRYAGSWSI
ncbi:MAG: DinB family protein [Phycisphaerales bacterium]